IVLIVLSLIIQTSISPHLLRSVVMCDSSNSLRLIVLIVLSFRSQTSIFSSVSVVASSQSSGEPGTVGVSTQTVFLCVPLAYSAYFALIKNVSLAPIPSSGIVCVHLLPLIVPTTAETSVTSFGASSVTTASLITTLPLLRTVIA